MNFWENPVSEDNENSILELRRSSDDCKKSQVEQVNWRNKVFEKEITSSLKSLKLAAKENRNIFEELMEASKWCTLGTITNALFDVGGEYRRNM